MLPAMRATVASLVVFALAAAAPALAQAPAQNRAEPWRGPSDQPGTRAADNRARVTSDAAATQPTAAEQREARALASAIFAKPGAAQRAAEKAAPETPPDYADLPAKPEWAGAGELKPGGRGVKVTQPF
jgi:hypothetical protein